LEKMRKLVSFMHITLDGFIAGPKGEMNWINLDNEIFDEADKCASEADIALYGRNTYEMMEAYWPTAGDNPNASKHDIHHSTWYNKVPKVILSTTMQETKDSNTSIINNHLTTHINELKQQPGKNIVIFGSPTAVRSLLRRNLIDDLWLFVNPVILGQGIPLFKDIKEPIHLKLSTNKAYPSGVICLHYQKK
jgi:dihydrofolate reductase